MSIYTCDVGEEGCVACDSASQANDLMTALDVDGLGLPELDINSSFYTFPSGTEAAMYAAIPPITLGELTTRTIKGDGVFDAMMESFSVHLKGEYSAGRITGAEYSKAYTSLAESAMQGSITFLLGKDQAFWQSQLAQVQALTARVTFETAKAALIAQRAEVMTQRATFALTKLKLSTEEATYCTALYNLQKLMPQQKLNLIAQHTLMTNQSAVQWAQTHNEQMDTLSTPVGGVLGKQMALYTQQITSYQRDSEYKAVKVFTDAWVAQKTIDEGLLAPSNFTNAAVDTVLTQFRTNNGLS